MKILVQTPLKNEEIKALLTSQPHDGVSFSFAGKRGLALEFEIDGGTAEQAIAAAKAVIRSTDWGKVLYFSVVAG